MKTALLLGIAYALISGATLQLPPFFVDDVVYPFIPEGNYTGTPRHAFTLKARVHSGTVDISVSTGSSESIVFINNTQNGTDVKGDVFVNSELDREMTQDVRLLFIATSSDQHAPVTRRYVTLYITDVNDESPIFHPPSYQVLIPENYPVNTAVQRLTIKAVDPDNGAGGTVTYRIETTGQAENLYRGYFVINPESGIVTLKKKLDYETLTFLQYNVIATDGAPPYHNTTAELLVKVQDVQDKPPVFMGLPYMKTILETTQGIMTHEVGMQGSPAACNCENSISTTSTRPPPHMDSYSGQSFVLCQGQEGYIQCDAGKVIRILSAMYGRTSDVICPSHNVGSLTCQSHSSSDHAKWSCNGYGRCSLFADSSVFGEPCTGINKYLEVSFHCVHPSTINGVFG